MRKSNNNQKGFSLVELLVAIIFISVITIAILNVIKFSSKQQAVNQERLQAILYSQEVLEAAQIIPWSSFQPGNYRLELTDEHWTLVSGNETLDDKYLRTITIGNVYRTDSVNGQVFGDIVESPGNLDPNTYKVQVTVDWTSQKGGSYQEQMSTYIHRWRADRWTQTDWEGGPGQNLWQNDNRFSTSDAGIDYSIPGILSLQIGSIDWTNASTTGSYNTPGNFDDNDVVAQDDRAYLVTENNPSDKELYVLDISDIHHPALITSLEVGSSLTGVSLKNNYLYLSSNDNSGEFKIVDVANPASPVLLSSADLSGNEDGNDVESNGTEAFIIQGNILHSFDVSNPNIPVPLDSVNVVSIGEKLYLSGNYLYVATQDAAAELKIVDVTNPASMQLVGSFNLAGSVKANDVFVVGSRAYVSTDNSGSSPEFYIVDVSNPASPQLLGAHEISETVFSLVVIGDFALVGTNFLDEELVVLDVSNPANISNVGAYDLLGHILGMSTNCSTIFAATSGNQGEFFIVSTGVPDCDISTQGTLESSTFDTGSANTEYNWVSWSEVGTPNTLIRMQIATSQLETGPWNFLGPDGTSGSYYTDSSGEPINNAAHLHQRYLRYKVYLSTMAAYDVPVFEEVVISYSPNQND